MKYAQYNIKILYPIHKLILIKIEVMTWRKRRENEQGRFNIKLEESSSWDEKFNYPFISEIIEVCLPKVNVSRIYI